MEAPSPKWTEAELRTDAVSKKQIAEFLQANASYDFLRPRQLIGKIAKANSKEALIKAYLDLFETKAFRNPEEEARKEAERAAAAAAKPAAKSQEEVKEEKKEQKKEEKVGYTKEIIRKGDGVNFPKKGTLPDGKVFDSNMENPKKTPPLKFKVGIGKVIRGWDHALQTMSVGEVARLRIEPDWAYGKKGVEGRVPPNSPLIFEVELLAIE